MQSEPIKQTWLERAKDTHNYHISKRRDNQSWKLRDTAKALHRSVGSISEDLLVAKWMRTHRVQLERFEHFKDALEWIRKKKDLIEYEELD